MYTLREWQTMQKEKKDLIVQASTLDGRDGQQPFPIGMSYQYLLHDNWKKETQIGSHDNLVLCAIRPHTDHNSRNKLRKTSRNTALQVLARNGITNTMVGGDQYFVTLPTYKFVISPEGNGVDCHRHYEALMAGCIPIVEHNPHIKYNYEGCPILYTYDYSEITPAYLEKKYSEMLDQKYNFSKLFLNSHPPKTQKIIKECSTYWTVRLTNKVWYTN
jgi:hypothetical protein